MPLTKPQYQQLMRGYDLRRNRALVANQKRKEALYASHPELQDLHNRIVSNRAEAASARISGASARLMELEEEKDALLSEQAALWESIGITAADLEPHFTCQDCQDTGYIGEEKCHCFDQRIVNLLYEMSNLSAVLQRENFDTLTMRYYSKEAAPGQPSQYAKMEGKIALIRRFCENFDRNPESLYLFGPTGVGKSFLSHCIAKYLLDTGHSVAYFPAPKLIDLLIQDYRRNPDQENTLSSEYFMDCDLLIIDDLGTEYANRLSQEKLFSCINERQLRLKSTLISTNLNPDELRAVYTDRLASRINGNYRLIRMEGEDIRLMKRAEKQQ